MFESYTQDKGAVGPHKHTSSPAKPEGTIVFKAAQRKKSQKSHIVFSRISTIFADGKPPRPQWARQKPAAATPGFPGRNTNRFPQGSSNGGMVDTKDLKSFGHCGCAGSSPASSTESHAEYSAWLSCFYCSKPLRQDSFHYITLCNILLLRFMVSCFVRYRFS